jgi:hypothetical protein
LITSNPQLNAHVVGHSGHVGASGINHYRVATTRSCPGTIIPTGGGSIPFETQQFGTKTPSLSFFAHPLNLFTGPRDTPNETGLID